jgi:hypothetical protein
MIGTLKHHTLLVWCHGREHHQSAVPAANFHRIGKEKKCAAATVLAALLDAE